MVLPGTNLNHAADQTRILILKFTARPSPQAAAQLSSKSLFAIALQTRFVKSGFKFRRSFNYHDCSVTGQITPQGHHQHVNASGGKVWFELATDGIRLYVFAN